MDQELRWSLRRRIMDIGTVNSVDAVGVWFYSLDTNRYLYLLRNDDRHPGCWGLAGGKRESGETLLECMRRECVEELGFFPEYIKISPVEQFTTHDEKFSYHTFVCVIDKEFCPRLNDEHLGYAWIDSGKFPHPMHPGLWNTVKLDAIQSKLKILESYTSQ